MVGDFGWEHEGRKSRVGAVNQLLPERTLFSDKKLWKMSMVGPKCAFWRSNQE